MAIRSDAEAPYNVTGFGASIPEQWLAQLIRLAELLPATRFEGTKQQRCLDGCIGVAALVIEKAFPPDAMYLGRRITST